MFVSGNEIPNFVIPTEENIFIAEPEVNITQLIAVDFNGNSISNFEITGIDKNLFMINHENYLLLKNPSNYETKSSYEIKIVAIAENGNSIDISINIQVQDGNF